MNKHILLVMKWLNDSDSVTQEELESNADAAHAAAAAYVADADAVYAYAYAAAADVAYHAAYHAEKWVAKYFERSGEDRQLYVDALLPTDQRITIKTQNLGEAHAIHDKIGHLTRSAVMTKRYISYVLLPNVKLMDIAKLLEVHKSVSCNLATKIAWLEGLSVASECTGEQYCLLVAAGNPRYVKYDPIGRPALLMELIKKYHVDLDWRADGSCAMALYDLAEPLRPSSLAHNSTDDHNGCFATTVLTAILEAHS